MIQYIKPFKTLTYALILLLAGSMQGCLYTYSTKQQKDIDESDKKEIKQIIDKIIIALKKDNTLYLYSICSDEIKKDFPKEKINNLVNSVDIINGNEETKVEGEFMITNSPTSNITKVTSNGYTDNFTVDVKLVKSKTYAYFFSVNSKEQNFRTLVTCVFVREHNDWKLNIFTSGLFSYKNKQAPEYYKIANDLFMSNDLMQSALYMQLSSVMMKPASNILHYTDETKMEYQYKNIQSEAGERFTIPMKVSTIKTKPEITMISLTESGGEVLPIIKYYSDINVSDKAAVVSENNELHKITGDLFPHINNFADSICYKISNQNSENGKATGFIIIKQSSATTDTTHQRAAINM